MNLTFQTEELLSGLDWSWTESLADYLATEYTLVIIIKKGTDTAVTLTGVANGTDFDFTVTAAASLTYSFGEYSFQAIVTNISTSKVKIIAAGRIKIHPLLSTAGDTRTFWEKQLDAAKTAYETLNTLTATEVNFKGKMIKYAERGTILSAMHYAEEKIKEEKELAEGKIKKSKIFKAAI